MAHFNPFARPAASTPTHRDDEDDRNDWNEDDDEDRRYRRRAVHRNTGLIVIDLGL